MSRLLQTLKSTPFLGVVLFAFSVGFPPLDDVTSINLSVHMAQHVMIIIAGVMIAYPLHERWGFMKSNRAGSLGLLAVVLIMLFWHLPQPWDAAVLNPAVHAVEHICFLAAGILIGSALQRLSEAAKINCLLLAFFGHMAYGMILISPLNINVYPLYPLSQQSTLGLVILAPAPAYWAGIIYMLVRGHRAKAEVGGMAVAGVKRSRNGRLPTLAVPALSIVLLAVMVSYFAMTAAAISASPSQKPLVATVYIVETPVTWQYSPQSIQVAIGVNNTVTWVSHSIAYDTITAVNGSFSSGPIPPGGTFTYTFTQPGRYEYRCLYHPWMIGYVTVLRAP